MRRAIIVGLLLGGLFTISGCATVKLIHDIINVDR